MSDSNIFKREICSICGKIAYRQYLGTNQYDGGYTTVNEFEPSDYEYLRLGNSSFTVCPNCLSEIQDFVFQLAEVKRTNKTNL